MNRTTFPNDGFYIRVPDNNNQLIPIYCELFEEAMEKYFEGYNPPFLVIDQQAEDFTTSIKRVNQYLKKKQTTGTEQQVCEDITKRQQKGIAKYGTTVANNPLALGKWLQHAYEEALDQAVYLKRAIQELDNQKPE
jgi:hypothetical protein